jgi:hypothetical protein
VAFLAFNPRSSFFPVGVSACLGSDDFQIK